MTHWMASSRIEAFGKITFKMGEASTPVTNSVHINPKDQPHYIKTWCLHQKLKEHCGTEFLLSPVLWDFFIAQIFFPAFICLPPLFECWHSLMVMACFRGYCSGFYIKFQFGGCSPDSWSVLNVSSCIVVLRHREQRHAGGCANIV